jgi:hypothetical protein
MTIKEKETIDVIDREKVIRAVDSCFNYWLDQHRYLHPLELENVQQLKADAIALLKKQEPILLENQHKPYGINTNANSPWISRCPKCGKKVEGKQTRYCKYCGQAVKWDD